MSSTTPNIEVERDAIRSLMEQAPPKNGDEDSALLEYIQSQEPERIKEVGQALSNAHKEFCRIFEGRVSTTIAPEIERPDLSTQEGWLQATTAIEKTLSANWIELYMLLAIAHGNEAEAALFVHVPKCFGSKISNAVSACSSGKSTYCYSIIRLGGGWVKPWQRANDLRRLCNSAQDIRRIFIGGHLRLSEAKKIAMANRNSFIFSTIRHPVEIAVSHVNYILTCIRDHPCRPDSVNWTKRLKKEGIEVTLGESGKEEERALALLRTDYFRASYSNLLTRAYAPRPKAKVKEIVDYISAAPACRLYEASALKKLYRDLGLENEPGEERFNKSISFIEKSQLQRRDIDYIKKGLTLRDRRLWKHLREISVK